MTSTFLSAIALLSLLFTLPPCFIFFSRLLKGPQRQAPISPQRATLDQLGTTSIIVPTLNEADRIQPCLDGLKRQSYEVREMLIVDSQSQDGTREMVQQAQSQDPRIRLITDDPLPSDWVGRPWALHNGFLASSPKSDWILGLDADTQPQPGLVAGLLRVANQEDYDLISLSPQFLLAYPGEWLLQPALLMTLLYRFDPSGATPSSPERVMANGQCFLCRRGILEDIEGYSVAKGSFCDDVTLARYIAQQGYKVGFLDGKRVLKVRMYEGAKETWQEWGRSLDLKDASAPGQLWGDLWLLLTVQGLPLLLTVFWGSLWLLGYQTLPVLIALGVNGLLVGIRWSLLLAIAPSYDRNTPQFSPLFWLSPLADPLAVLRIFLSAWQTPKQWRGRVYSNFNETG
ncbi:glycosyltransferase family 2 protein [Spirulina sp. CS-785/01]|uniref:2'-O-glycosyltransferase CruG n=1 Tax=Spirulina sp. CS-785/01 TaxID=3021716 RepID=UPI00232D65E0|nr:glycosyltransferase family 2 protein [Spirulina sp. CS-785/01]MDB9311628.1 glycosyltransferase family 2 protein [Spirulina sp. CS-785/01]